jgi:hypothetical protein
MNIDKKSHGNSLGFKERRKKEAKKEERKILGSNTR